MRKLPIFTVVNKMDRPALNGFEIIEQLEKEFQLPAYPVNWPIGSGDRFCGVFHRPTNKVSEPMPLALINLQPEQINTLCEFVKVFLSTSLSSPLGDPL